MKIKTSSGESKKKCFNKYFINIWKSWTKNFKDVISVYTKEKYSFYQDLNTWLRELDSLAYDKIGYFVSDFIYCLNKYGEFKQVGINKTITLYRGIKINLIDLLFYKRNKNKIIIFPAFTSSSVELKDAIIICERNKNLYKRKKSGLFSTIIE